LPPQERRQGKSLQEMPCLSKPVKCVVGSEGGGGGKAVPTDQQGGEILRYHHVKLPEEMIKRGLGGTKRK